MPLLTEAPWGTSRFGWGRGLLGFLLVFINLDQVTHETRSWSNPADLHKFLQTHTGVYALLALAFPQSGLRLGTFIGWILVKQKARNKNNSLGWVDCSYTGINPGQRY